MIILTIFVIIIPYAAIVALISFIQYYFGYKPFHNKKNPYYNEVLNLFNQKEQLLENEQKLRYAIKELEKEYNYALKESKSEYEYMIKIEKCKRLELIKELTKVADNYFIIRNKYNEFERNKHNIVHT